MTTGQLYSSKKYAVRAAIVHFGRLAAEGSHFTVQRKKQPNGMFRFYYTAVTGAPGAAEATGKAPVVPPHPRSAGKATPQRPPSRPKRGRRHRVLRPPGAVGAARKGSLNRKESGVRSQESGRREHLGFRSESPYALPTDN